MIRYATSVLIPWPQGDELTCRGTQFLVVNLGESGQSTPTITKTLNPEWNVSFDLPITGPKDLLLEATCWDKDRFSNDYMGEFDVAVEDVFGNGKVTQQVQWHDSLGF